MKNFEKKKIHLSKYSVIFLVENSCVGCAVVKGVKNIWSFNFQNIRWPSKLGRSVINYVQIDWDYLEPPTQHISKEEFYAKIWGFIFSNSVSINMRQKHAMVLD